MQGTSHSRNAKFCNLKKNRNSNFVTNRTDEHSKFNQLCLKCGLCCNGGIFADVSLEGNETAAQYRVLGLLFKGQSCVSKQPAPSDPPKFVQPCSALCGSRCMIYAQRPAHCRKFDCLLLTAAVGGEVDLAEALGVVSRAVQARERILAMLRALGNVDESSPIRSRFAAVTEHFETYRPTREQADAYGELTLAMHEFNMLISERFYDGHD